MRLVLHKPEKTQRASSHQ
jgi:hypothetical protein